MKYTHVIVMRVFEEEGWGKKNIRWPNDSNISKFNENEKPINPRSSFNPKHTITSEAHQNQIA